jgi:hypothetical protein
LEAQLFPVALAVIDGPQVGDAGQNLDHFQSFYKPQQPAELMTAIGIRKNDVVKRDVNASYVDQFAQGLASPIEVTVSAE